MSNEMGAAVAKRRRSKMHWQALWRCWSYCHQYIWAGGTHKLHTLWVLIPQSGQISWYDLGTGGILIQLQLQDMELNQGELAMIFQSVPHRVKGLVDHEKSMVRVLKNNYLYPALHYEQPNGGCLLSARCALGQQAPQPAHKYWFVPHTWKRKDGPHEFWVQYAWHH